MDQPSELETNGPAATVVCKGPPPLWHLKAMLEALLADDNVTETTPINVLTLTPTSGVEVPTGEGGVTSGVAGTFLIPPGSAVLTWDECPAAGAVWIPDGN